MKNFGQMMQKVQEMQEKMQNMQEQMEDLEIEGSSGAGSVVVVLNGKGNMRRITIDPGIVNSQDVEILEDLIVAAVNDYVEAAPDDAEICFGCPVCGYNCRA